MDTSLDPQTGRIIHCAIELHRALGPGLLEGIYRKGLAIEFDCQAIRYVRERRVSVVYRNRRLGEFYPDFIVENEVIVEIKAASSHDRVFDAQVLTYMRLTGLKKGLLLNFGRPVLKDGIKRFAL